MVKVKKSAVGKSIYHKSIGFFTIKENHSEMLLKIGRVEFLDGVPLAKKLVPKKATTRKKNADTSKK